MLDAQLGVAPVHEPERVIDPRPPLHRPEVEHRLIDRKARTDVRTRSAGEQEQDDDGKTAHASGSCVSSRA